MPAPGIASPAIRVGCQVDGPRYGIWTHPSWTRPLRYKTHPNLEQAPDTAQQSDSPVVGRDAAAGVRVSGGASAGATRSRAAGVTHTYSVSPGDPSLSNRAVISS